MLASLATAQPETIKGAQVIDRLRTLIYPPEWQAWVDPEVPEYFSPTSYLLDRHVENGEGDRVALRVDGDAVTYSELLSAVGRAANSLSDAGVRSEDRILLFGSDSLEYLSCWLGAVRIGAVPAVVSDRYPADQLQYFLRDTAARALLIDVEQWDKLTSIADDLPEALSVVVVRAGSTDEFDRSVCRTGIEVLSLGELLEGRSSSRTPTRRHANDIAYMFYSGGTTGTAKGIVHLAHDFLLVPERQGAFWSIDRNDVCFATSKKYFTHGLWPGVLIPLYFGGTGIIRRDSPSAEQVIDVVETERPTVLITVPTVLKLLVGHARESGATSDFSSLRMVVSASEKMPDVLFERFLEHFGVEVLDSIGSSEITYEWLANRPEHSRRGSVGKPVYGFEVKLMDAMGAEVTEPQHPGEAWVKSRTACLFYWRKLDRTKEVFQGQWTRTGDVLEFDEDGFFWFSSRSDDLFKVRGLWVSPVEVEDCLMRHPAVVEAAVIPMTDREGLTAVKAVVVLREGRTQSESLTEELRDHAAEVGRYKAPAIVEYVDALPRTTLQKIDRRALRNRDGATGATP